LVKLSAEMGTKLAVRDGVGHLVLGGSTNQ
jgi:hypothetical protein